MKTENRKGKSALVARPGNGPAPSSLFYFPFSIFLFLFLLGGCASPGEPTERKAPVPRAVSDLAARQSGSDVVLTFTLPGETVDHRPLERPPAVEIYRDFEILHGTGEARQLAPANPTLLVTIPAAMVEHYAARDQVRYADSLQAGDFAKHPGAVVDYFVRTRASAKKASGDSNAVHLRIYPAPDPISDLRAEVTQSAVALGWTPPQRDSVGGAPRIFGYRIYRAEAEPGAAGAVAKATSSPALIAEPDGPFSSFSDSNFDFGKTYVYLIRSVVQSPDGPLESGDSNTLVVAPKDTFPPDAPLRLEAVFVPAQRDMPEHLELSWAVSPETDIAGYNVYRSEQVGVLGTRVNTELLLTPAFRDMTVMSGHRYFYSVTAADRSGNEGPSSAVVSGGVPAESHSTP